ncbi:MAG: hypothetical protein KF841_06095 [Phycisphaerae bacterium]|nr:hypothetical protein [Phycisphaerae bacterium]
MAVARSIRAKDGDTLCSIAVDNGFKNCTKFRAHNTHLASRQVKAGDQVNIPELTEKQEPGQTEMRHRFQRLGRKKRIFIIQDNNRAKPEQALSDIQRELAVSNYVPTRQGTGFTTADWRSERFFGHSTAASADPDHFKVQVFDPMAAARGENEVKITLQSQRPVLDADLKITQWNDMTEAGTKLVDVICRQVEADSPWYRSHYLRLVVDTQDQTAKRPHGRTTPTADGGRDVSKQTLVVQHVTADNRIEVLDLRVMAHQPEPACEHADPAGHCVTFSLADVGKNEKVIRVNLVRVGGAATSGIDDARMNKMIFENMRLTLAQANIGVQLVGGAIRDVPEPKNMIVVSDYHAAKSSGGGTMEVKVRLASGDVTATISTDKKKKPVETGNKLATALRAVGVKCRVSPNKPISSSGDDFGSCDILCFNPDDSLATVLSATSTDTDQKLSHSGGFDTMSVKDNVAQYTDPSTPAGPAQIVGSIDFRAVCKNFNEGGNHLGVLVVGGFTRLPLLGKAMLPYRGIAERIRPLTECSMCVFVDAGGVDARTVLTHEAGHVLLDAFHTTLTDANESDLFGNQYDNNTNLAYSEWMSAFNREPDFIHKRMSDRPLTVKFNIVKIGASDIEAEEATLGGAGQATPVERFLTLSASTLGPLRKLKPAPGSGL